MALINTNQRGQALAHSIEIAGARHLIAGCELAACVPRGRTLLHRTAVMLGSGRRHDGLQISMRALAACARHIAPGKTRAPGVTAKDRAFFIYTSGTTGLPKAANFSHMRMLFMMSGFVGALEPKASDRIYNPLPLYHATGGVCAVGMALHHRRRADPQAQILGAANSGATFTNMTPPCSTISASCAAIC